MTIISFIPIYIYAYMHIIHKHWGHCQQMRTDNKDFFGGLKPSELEVTKIGISPADH